MSVRLAQAFTSWKLEISYPFPCILVSCLFPVKDMSQEKQPHLSPTHALLLTFSLQLHLYHSLSRLCNLMQMDERFEPDTEQDHKPHPALMATRGHGVCESTNCLIKLLSLVHHYAECLKSPVRCVCVKNRGKVVGGKSAIPAIMEDEQGDLEMDASLGYIVRPTPQGQQKQNKDIPLPVSKFLVPIPEQGNLMILPSEKGEKKNKNKKPKSSFVFSF